MFGFLREPFERRRVLRELEDLRRRHDALLDAYEKLSKKYIELSNPNRDRFPGVNLCERRAEETYAFFRVDGDDCIPRLERFLADSGRPGWKAEKSETFETGDPAYAVGDGHARILVRPGQVLLASVDAKWDCLVMPEKVFHEAYMIVP